MTSPVFRYKYSSQSRVLQIKPVHIQQIYILRQGDQPLSSLRAENSFPFGPMGCETPPGTIFF
jgi:hypothetical protein